MKLDTFGWINPQFSHSRNSIELGYAFETVRDVLGLDLALKPFSLGA